MASFTRVGYGVVEPNQLSAQKTGQIFASLPLDENVETLENGTFMYYDYVTGKVTATAPTAGGEPMLVFNEIKLYDQYKQQASDFALIRFDDGLTAAQKAIVAAAMPYNYRMGDDPVPRLFKTNVGDIMTTNMVPTGVEYAVGDVLVPTLDSTSKTLVLTKGSATSGAMAWVVAKVYTMPDGQPGLKVQRVQ